MPYINCRVMEGVLSDDQKAEIAERITETFASVVGEPVRGLTWVVIDDIASGELTIGGRPHRGREGGSGRSAGGRLNLRVPGGGGALRVAAGRRHRLPR